MAIITSTIGSNARQYATVALWNASLPATAPTDSYVGELYNDSEFVLSAAVNIGAGTSGYPITLRPATGQGFRDHANRLTNPLRYDQTKGVGLRTTTAAINMLASVNPLVVIDGLQLQANQADPYNLGTLVDLQDGGVIKNSLMHAVAGAKRAILRLGHLSKGVNCVLIRQDSAASYAFFTDGSLSELRNCTIVRASDAGTGGTAIVAGYTSGTTIIKNCAVFGPWSAHFSASGNFDQANSGYNATDSASAPGTTGNVYNLTYASQFEGVATANLDFRAKVGGGLAVGLRDAANTADLDIIGQTRSLTTPLIGAWELPLTFAFNGGAILSRVRLRTVVSSGVFSVVYRITGRMVDPSTGLPRANVTGINAAFFDEATPSAFTTPKQIITNLSTDVNGDFSWPLPNSALVAGQIGTLIPYHAGLGYLGAYRLALVA